MVICLLKPTHACSSIALVVLTPATIANLALLLIAHPIHAYKHEMILPQRETRKSPLSSAGGRPLPRHGPRHPEGLTGSGKTQRRPGRQYGAPGRPPCSRLRCRERGGRRRSACRRISHHGLERGCTVTLLAGMHRADKAEADQALLYHDEHDKQGRGFARSEFDVGGEQCGVSVFLLLALHVGVPDGTWWNYRRRSMMPRGVVVTDSRETIAPLDLIVFRAIIVGSISATTISMVSLPLLRSLTTAPAISDTGEFLSASSFMEGALHPRRRGLRLKIARRILFDKLDGGHGNNAAVPVSVAGGKPRSCRVCPNCGNSPCWRFEIAEDQSAKTKTAQQV